MKVSELLPGDEIVLVGSEVSGVFITRAEHPKYLGLQLVVWRLSDGTLSFDALHAHQDVGESVPSNHVQRGERLIAAVRGDS